MFANPPCDSFWTEMVLSARDPPTGLQQPMPFQRLHQRLKQMETNFYAMNPPAPPPEHWVVKGKPASAATLQSTADGRAASHGVHRSSQNYDSAERAALRLHRQWAAQELRTTFTIQRQEDPPLSRRRIVALLEEAFPAPHHHSSAEDGRLSARRPSRSHHQHHAEDCGPCISPSEATTTMTSGSCIASLPPQKSSPCGGFHMKPSKSQHAGRYPRKASRTKEDLQREWWRKYLQTPVRDRPVQWVISLPLPCAMTSPMDYQHIVMAHHTMQRQRDDAHAMAAAVRVTWTHGPTPGVPVPLVLSSTEPVVPRVRRAPPEMDEEEEDEDEDEEWVEEIVEVVDEQILDEEGLTEPAPAAGLALASSSSVVRRPPSLSVSQPQQQQRSDSEPQAVMPLQSSMCLPDEKSDAARGRASSVSPSPTAAESAAAHPVVRRGGGGAGRRRGTAGGNASLSPSDSYSPPPVPQQPQQYINVDLLEATMDEDTIAAVPLPRRPPLPATKEPPLSSPSASPVPLPREESPVPRQVVRDPTSTASAAAVPSSVFSLSPAPHSPHSPAVRMQHRPPTVPVTTGPPRPAQTVSSTTAAATTAGPATPYGYRAGDVAAGALRPFRFSMSSDRSELLLRDEDGEEEGVAANPHHYRHVSPSPHQVHHGAVARPLRHPVVRGVPDDGRLVASSSTPHGQDVEEEEEEESTRNRREERHRQGGQRMKEGLLLASSSPSPSVIRPPKDTSTPLEQDASALAEEMDARLANALLPPTRNASTFHLSLSSIATPHRHQQHPSLSDGAPVLAPAAVEDGTSFTHSPSLSVIRPPSTSRDARDTNTTTTVASVRAIQRPGGAPVFPSEDRSRSSPPPSMSTTGLDRLRALPITGRHLQQHHLQAAQDRRWTDETTEEEHHGVRVPEGGEPRELLHRYFAVAAAEAVQRASEAEEAEAAAVMAEVSVVRVGSRTDSTRTATSDRSGLLFSPAPQSQSGFSEEDQPPTVNVAVPSGQDEEDEETLGSRWAEPHSIHGTGTGKCQNGCSSSSVRPATCDGVVRHSGGEFREERHTVSEAAKPPQTHGNSVPPLLLAGEEESAEEETPQRRRTMYYRPAATARALVPTGTTTTSQRDLIRAAASPPVLVSTSQSAQRRCLPLNDDPLANTLRPETSLQPPHHPAVHDGDNTSAVEPSTEPDDDDIPNGRETVLSECGSVHLGSSLWQGMAVRRQQQLEKSPAQQRPSTGTTRCSHLLLSQPSVSYRGTGDGDPEEDDTDPLELDSRLSVALFSHPSSPNSRLRVRPRDSLGGLAPRKGCTTADYYTAAHHSFEQLVLLEEGEEEEDGTVFSVRSMLSGMTGEVQTPVRHRNGTRSVMSPSAVARHYRLRQQRQQHTSGAPPRPSGESYFSTPRHSQSHSYAHLPPPAVAGGGSPHATTTTAASLSHRSSPHSSTRFSVSRRSGGQAEGRPSTDDVSEASPYRAMMELPQPVPQQSREGHHDRGSGSLPPRGSFHGVALRFSSGRPSSSLNFIAATTNGAEGSIHSQQDVSHAPPGLLIGGSTLQEWQPLEMRPQQGHSFSWRGPPPPPAREEPQRSPPMGNGFTLLADSLEEERLRLPARGSLLFQDDPHFVLVSRRGSATSATPTASVTRLDSVDRADAAGGLSSPMHRLYQTPSATTTTTTTTTQPQSAPPFGTEQDNGRVSHPHSRTPSIILLAGGGGAGYPTTPTRRLALEVELEADWAAAESRSATPVFQYPGVTNTGNAGGGFGAGALWRDASLGTPSPHHRSLRCFAEEGAATGGRRSSSSRLHEAKRRSTESEKEKEEEEQLRGAGALLHSALVCDAKGSRDSTLAREEPEDVSCRVYCRSLCRSGSVSLQPLVSVSSPYMYRQKRPSRVEKENEPTGGREGDAQRCFPTPPGTAPPPGPPSEEPARFSTSDVPSPPPENVPSSGDPSLTDTRRHADVIPSSVSCLSLGSSSCSMNPDFRPPSRELQTPSPSLPSAMTSRHATHPLHRGEEGSEGPLKNRVCAVTIEVAAHPWRKSTSGSSSSSTAQEGGIYHGWSVQQPAVAHERLPAKPVTPPFTPVTWAGRTAAAAGGTPLLLSTASPLSHRTAQALSSGGVGGNAVRSPANAAALQPCIVTSRQRTRLTDAAQPQVEGEEPRTALPDGAVVGVTRVRAVQGRVSAGGGVTLEASLPRGETGSSTSVSKSASPVTVRQSEGSEEPHPLGFTVQLTRFGAGVPPATAGVRET